MGSCHIIVESLIHRRASIDVTAAAQDTSLYALDGEKILPSTLFALSAHLAKSIRRSEDGTSSCANKAHM